MPRRVDGGVLAAITGALSISLCGCGNEGRDPDVPSHSPDELHARSSLDASALDASALDASDAASDAGAEIVSMSRMANALARVLACSATWPAQAVPRAITFRHTYASQFPCMEEAETCSELFACDALREDQRREWPEIGPCDDHREGYCDGDRWRICLDGSEYEVDCSVIEGLTCGLDARGEAECVPVSSPCSPAESGCDGDVARVCTSSGVFVEYDCAALQAGSCLDCSQASPHCDAGRLSDPDYAHATCRLPSVACEAHLDCGHDQVCSREGVCASKWCDPAASRDRCPSGYACSNSYVCVR